MLPSREGVKADLHHEHRSGAADSTLWFANACCLASSLLVTTCRQRYDACLIARTHHLNSRFLILLLTALAVWIVSSTAVHAQTVHSLDDVRTTAVAAVRSQLPESPGKYFVTAGALDSRLRLVPCTTPLTAVPQSTGNANSRVTVGVHCNSGALWTVYVPVTIELEARVLVLQRNLGRDAHVDKADVQFQTKRVSGSATNFVTDLAALQGRHLKRPLTAGVALTMDALVVDMLIRRGQQVTLLAKSGTIEIRAQGRALADGGLNDRIRVQNVNSLKVVEGVVGDAGTVLVAL
jgi:flagella basal body P-ring formation protein FlgA